MNESAGCPRLFCKFIEDRGVGPQCTEIRYQGTLQLQFQNRPNSRSQLSFDMIPVLNVTTLSVRPSISPSFAASFLGMHVAVIINGA